MTVKNIILSSAVVLMLAQAGNTFAQDTTAITAAIQSHHGDGIAHADVAAAEKAVIAKAFAEGADIEAAERAVIKAEREAHGNAAEAEAAIVTAVAEAGGDTAQAAAVIVSEVIAEHASAAEIAEAANVVIATVKATHGNSAAAVAAVKAAVATMPADVQAAVQAGLDQADAPAVVAPVKKQQIAEDMVTTNEDNEEALPVANEYNGQG